MRALRMLINTAAAAISLAFLDNGCNSALILSLKFQSLRGILRRAR